MKLFCLSLDINECNDVTTWFDYHLFIDINESIGTSQECSQIITNPIYVHVNQDVTILTGNGICQGIVHVYLLSTIIVSIIH